MRGYVTAARANQILASGQALQYPHAEPLSAPFDGFRHPDGAPNVPSPLVREVLSHINTKRRHVLDVGAGEGSTGLFLAAHGHDVTALDTDADAVRWQNARAKELGLSETFKAFRGDARELAETDRYDLVLAEMLLHFFNSVQASNIVRAMRAATRIGGINVVSVYTEENPDEETLPPNDRIGLMRPGSLPLHYGTGWGAIRSAEGLAARFVARPELGRGIGLVADIAELVVVKNTEETAPIASGWFGAGVSSGTTSYVI